jgi:hypothetical protein
MRSRVSLFCSLASLALVPALASCGSDDPDSAPVDCPSFADVSAAPDGEGVKDFTVTLDLALMRDPEERAERIREVGGPLCLSVTEERTVGLDSVLVDAGRPLDPAGQALLIEALRGVEGVVAAEPGAADREAGSGPAE